MEMATKVKYRTSFVTFSKTKIRKFIGEVPGPTGPPSRYTPDVVTRCKHGKMKKDEKREVRKAKLLVKLLT